MQSPLAALSEVLKEVKRRAEVYKPSNEAQTREALINPILEALGWNLSDPEEVELEMHLNSGQKHDFIDYVLKGDGKIIVEAKKIGTALDNGFDQIFLYAQRAKVKNVFLTNGLEWRHYINQNSESTSVAGHINFKPGNEPINLGNIANDDLPKKAAAYLVAHLDAALYRTPPVKPEKTDLKTKVADLESTIKDMEARLKSGNGEKSITVPTLPPSDVRPWKLFRDDWDPTGKSPKLLKLTDNKEIEVNGWKQVLWETCKFCLEIKPDLIDGAPIKDGSKSGRRDLVGTILPSKSNKQLDINGKTVFVDCNYSAMDVLKNAGYMLEKLGDGTAAKAAILLAE